MFAILPKRGELIRSRHAPPVAQAAPIGQTCGPQGEALESAPRVTVR